jgi:hypothetical protein
MVNAPS